MDSRFKTKTVHEIDSNDLNELMQETYGLDEFFGTEESPNDSTHSFTVVKLENKYKHGTEEDRAKVIAYDKADLAEYIEAKSCCYYSLGIILDDMCDKGVIEEGEYLVSVFW